MFLSPLVLAKMRHPDLCRHLMKLVLHDRLYLTWNWTQSILIRGVFCASFSVLLRGLGGLCTTLHYAPKASMSVILSAALKRKMLARKHRNGERKEKGYMYAFAETLEASNAGKEKEREMQMKKSATRRFRSLFCSFFFLRRRLASQFTSFHKSSSSSSSSSLRAFSGFFLFVSSPSLPNAMSASALTSSLISTMVSV